MANAYVVGPISKHIVEELQKVGLVVSNISHRDPAIQDINHIIAEEKSKIAAADYIIVNYTDNPLEQDIELAFKIFFAWQIGKAPIVIAPRDINPWVHVHAISVVNTVEEACQVYLSKKDGVWKRDE